MELIEPLRGESIYVEFLQTRGEGLHHFGVSIEGIEKKIAAMKQIGIEVLQSGKRPGVTFAYVDTEALIGTIIEFVERID